MKDVNISLLLALDPPPLFPTPFSISQLFSTLFPTPTLPTTEQTDFPIHQSHTPKPHKIKEQNASISHTMNRPFSPRFDVLCIFFLNLSLISHHSQTKKKKTPCGKWYLPPPNTHTHTFPKKAAFPLIYNPRSLASQRHVCHELSTKNPAEITIELPTALFHTRTAPLHFSNILSRD